MKIIEKLSDMIEDELEGAENYIKCALEHKDEYPELAKTFSQLSEEEMGHMAKLHKAVVVLIENYREKQGQPPADMMAVYEYLHKKHIEKAAEIKVMQGMFKE